MNMNVIIKTEKRPHLRGGAAFRVSGLRRRSPRLLEVLAERGSLGPPSGFAPGDKIKIDVGGPTRSYTPAEFTADRLRFVGVVHGGGPGSDWLAALQLGDAMRFVGPVPSLPAPDADIEWAAFVGDETTLGAAEALLGALPKNVERLGALEVHEDSAAAVQEMDIPASVLARSNRGAELLRWAKTFRIPPGRGLMWLSGEATSLVPVMQCLLERGLKRNMLRIKPYWSVRGKANRKLLERGELR